MAPVRRYLRVSRYTVLEVRIHMDNPADTQRWLLHPREPALGRVISAIRPLIIPKLREENERVRKGKKKGPVKDVIASDDFEVTVLFTEGDTSHSVLKRHKTFSLKKGETDADGGAMGSQAAPVEVADDDNDDGEDGLGLVREESDGDEAVTKLEDIPSHDAATDGVGATADKPAEVGDASDDDDEQENGAGRGPDEKKKMGMVATYEGFRIHGYTLYLVVKRTGFDGGNSARDGGAGQSLIEGWITSTQSVPMAVDD